MDKPRPHDANADGIAEGDGEGATGTDAWASYRRWVARDSAAPVRRGPAEHSVYSWKGYQNWADRVRQSWKPES